MGAFCTTKKHSFVLKKGFIPIKKINILPKRKMSFQNEQVFVNLRLFNIYFYFLIEKITLRYH